MAGIGDNQTEAALAGRSWLSRLWNASWIPPGLVDRWFEFESAPAWILRARWAFLACAMFACFSSVGPMVLVELGALPLAVGFLLGLPAYWRTMGAVLLQPIYFALVLWAIWVLASLLWTPDLDKGVWEFGTLRFFWVPVALWPAMTHRRWLIGALSAGFLATNISQAWVALARWQGWTLLDPASEYPGRNPGWWVHPAICGYLLVAALGLHLPAAVMGKGRWAWAARGALVVTWLGILATGTRGAMLSGLALTLVVLGVGGVRAARSLEGAARRRWALSAVAGALVLAGVIGAGLAFTRAGNRVSEGVREVQRAARERDFSTFTGARVQFALWAWELWLDHPVRGVGAGGYEMSVRRMLALRGETAHTPHIAPQAHNALLHTGATLGIVGVALMIVIAAAALRGGFHRITPSALATYDAGPAFALVGMLLTTPFDVPYVNSPPSALLAVLIGLCLFARPKPAEGLRLISPR